MIINSCVTMPVVFNFLYIFLKKLKVIEPNILVAEKTLWGRRKLSRGGGGEGWGVRGRIGVRMKQPNFKDWKSLCKKMLSFGLKPV